jgi:DNA-directed RNA polymerase subunit alpha
MAVKFGKFEMPKKIVLEGDSATAVYGRFIAEPFERGFGHTVGNAMRRMLLSSLEAPAIISVRLEGVPHEYMAVEGIIEDMTNIVLNFKEALLRSLPVQEEVGRSRDSRMLTHVVEVTEEDLEKNQGQIRVKLGDLVKDPLFEVVNPDLHLFTITRPMKKQVDLRVAFGRGYVPSERHHVPGKLIDEILIDASFSPVRLVGYAVENTRVGQDTDYDRLILEVHTDGRVSPAESVSFAAQIGTRHFSVFDHIKAHDLVFEDGETESDDDNSEILDKLLLRIDEIELSVRSTNCLSGANIETIAELVSIPEKRMLEFRNFGKKSLNEIKAKLSEMGLYLGMDLARYGINADNVKERVRQLIEQKRAAMAPVATP